MEMNDNMKDCPLEGLLTEMNATEFELEDIFEIDGLDWTSERGAFSPPFDVEFAELGVGDMSGDSGVGASHRNEMFPWSPSPEREPASASPSPERVPRAQRRKRQDELSGRTINKNAIAARMNRLKKKNYVSGLEKNLGALSKENHVLKQENGQLNQRVEELEDETRYLRAVLANESMLAQLLSRLSGVNGMKLSSSLFQEHNETDHNYALPRKHVKVEEKNTSGGVCLHVDKDNVSLEFCTKCAESARTSFKIFFLGDGWSTVRMRGFQNIRVCLTSCGCRGVEERLDRLQPMAWYFFKGSVRYPIL